MRLIYIYIYWNSSSIQRTQVPLEYFQGTRVPQIFFLIFNFFKVSVHYNSIVQKLSFKLKLDLKKIEFQNRGIFQNSFRQRGILLESFGERGKCPFWPNFL